mgnify:CR=1 FL=1
MKQSKYSPIKERLLEIGVKDKDIKKLYEYSIEHLEIPFARIEYGIKKCKKPITIKKLEDELK